MGLEYYLYLYLIYNQNSQTKIVWKSLGLLERSTHDIIVLWLVMQWVHVVDLGSISWLEILVHKVAIHAVHLTSSQGRVLKANVNARVVCTGTSYACPASFVLF